MCNGPGEPVVEKQLHERDKGMAETMWHYSVGGQQYGPVPEEQLKQLIAAGQVAATDLVWRDGLPNWITAQSAPELGAPAVAGAVPAPVVGYYHSTVPQYAGFWLRFAANLIDSVITSLGGCVIGGVLGFMAGLLQASTGTEIHPAIFNLLGMVISWLYSALMESSSTQATLGKMAVGIYVTDLDGQRITFGRATARFFAKILSTLILFIGFIMVAFTERKQGLHDIVAGTLVLRK